MATATYEIVPSSGGVEVDLYGGSTFTATIRRTSSANPPFNAYVVSGRESITNVRCYSGTITQ